MYSIMGYVSVVCANVMHLASVFQVCVHMYMCLYLSFTQSQNINSRAPVDKFQIFQILIFDQQLLLLIIL